MKDDEFAEISHRIARLGRVHEDTGPARADLDPDPIGQFALWLEDALEAGIPLPNTMTLATASAEGRPSGRQVLLKSFDDRGFVFYTNYTSRKSREIEANPHAALVFHWPRIERQVRVTGTVSRVDRAESERYWATRDRASRLSAWISEQSSPISGRDELERRLAEADARFEGQDVPLPQFWGGYRLAPDEVEFWEARPNRLHDRWRYRRRGPAWVIDRLAP